MRFFLMILAVSFIAAISFAPDGAFATPAKEASEQGDISGRVLAPRDSSHKLVDDYVPATIENLSKLYWALGVFDWADVLAVDQYMMINECPLYRRYYRDDFALKELRDVMRESIRMNIPQFPRKLEVILRIGLERYNHGTERFQLSPATQFIGSKRVEFSGSSFSALCGQTNVTYNYPSNFIVNLQQPFTLTDISVTTDVAKAYIERIQERTPNPSTDDLRVSSLGRTAFLRLKISVSQFKEYSIGFNNERLVSFLGTIDGYEVFADENQEMLLYNEFVERRVLERRRKELSQRGPLVLDDAPLLKPTPKDEEEF